MAVHSFGLSDSKKLLGHARQGADGQRAINDEEGIAGRWRELGGSLEQQSHPAARAHPRRYTRLLRHTIRRAAAMTAEQLLRSIVRLLPNDAERRVQRIRRHHWSDSFMRLMLPPCAREAGARSATLRTHPCAAPVRVVQPPRSPSAR